MQAIHCVRNCAVAKFDETFEVTANLGIDPKKTNQILRGMLMVLGIWKGLTCSSLMETENNLQLPYLLMDNMQQTQRMLVPILSD